MLYDILPPTIFVLSVAGVVVVLSRVVARMNRSVLAADIQSVAAETSGGKTKTGRKHARLSQLLRPNQKRVQSAPSRVSQWRSAAAQATGSLSSAAKGVRGSLQLRDRVGKMGASVAQSARRASTAVSERVTAATEEMQQRRQEKEQASIATEEMARNTEPTSSVVQDAVSVTHHAVPKVKAVTMPMVTSYVHKEVKEKSLPKKATRAFKRKQKPTVSPLELATSALNEQRFAQAEDILIPYIVEHTKDTHAYMMLGQAALGQEHWSEAEEIFAQVVEWNPDEQGVYEGLGSAAFKAGHLSQALTALQRAHEADSENRSVLEQLLSIAQRMDNGALVHSITEKLKALGEEQTVSS